MIIIVIISNSLHLGYGQTNDKLESLDKLEQQFESINQTLSAIYDDDIVISSQPLNQTFEDVLIKSLLATNQTLKEILIESKGDYGQINQTLKVNDIIELGEVGITYNFREVLLDIGILLNPVNGYLYISDRTKLYVVDDNKIIDTIIAGVDLGDLIFNPVNNNIYLLDEARNKVVIIDSFNNVIPDSIDVGEFPGGIEIPFPTKDILYNPYNNYIYVTDFLDESISIINGSSNKVIDTIKLGSNPMAIEFNPFNNNTYVASSTFNLTIPTEITHIGIISVIDSSTNKIIDTIETNPTIEIHYNPINNNMYTVDSFHRINIVNSTTNTIVDTLSLDEISTSTLNATTINDTKITINQDNGNIYASNYNSIYHNFSNVSYSNTIYLINGISNKIMDTIESSSRELEWNRAGPGIFNPLNGLIYLSLAYCDSSSLLGYLYEGDCLAKIAILSSDIQGSQFR